MAEWLRGMVEIWRPILAHGGLTLQSQIDPSVGHVLGHWDYLTQVTRLLCFEVVVC